MAAECGMVDPTTAGLRTRSARLLAPLVLLALAGSSAAAQSIAVLPLQSATPTTHLTRNSETVSYAFTVANNGAAATQIKVAVRPFYHSGGQPCGATSAECNLRWYLGEQPIEPGVPVDLSLEPYRHVQLSLWGKARPLGTYDGSFVVGPASGTTPAMVPHTVRLTREAISLGASALDLGPGGTRTATLDGRLAPLKLRLLNETSTAVQLPPLALQLLKADDAGVFVHDAGVPTAACSPMTTGNRPLQVDQGLDCTVDLSVQGAPGRYRLDVIVSGAGIAKATSSREFNVRAHWLYAVLCLLLGGVAGGWFAGWQNSGRRRALQAAQALALSGEYQALSIAIPPPDGGTFKSRTIVNRIAKRLDDIVDALRTVSTADFATDLDDLSARLPLLHRFVELEKSFAALGAPAAAGPAHAAAETALATIPLLPDAGAKLDEFARQLAAARLPSPAKGLASNAPGEFFVKLRGQTAAALRALVARVDAILLYTTIVLVALVGVATLWRPDATWGSLGDVLVALFTGFAATSAGTAGLRELTSQYKLGKIA